MRIVGREDIAEEIRKSVDDVCNRQKFCQRKAAPLEAENADLLFVSPPTTLPRPLPALPRIGVPAFPLSSLKRFTALSTPTG